MPINYTYDLLDERNRPYWTELDLVELLPDLIHAIRNPAANVRGFSQLIRTMLQKGYREQLVQDFEVLRHYLDYHVRAAQFLDWYVEKRNDIPDTFPDGAFDFIPEERRMVLDPRDLELLTMTPRVFLEGLSHRLREEAIASINELPPDGAEVETNATVAMMQRIGARWQRIEAIIGAVGWVRFVG